MSTTLVVLAVIAAGFIACVIAIRAGSKNSS